MVQRIPERNGYRLAAQIVDVVNAVQHCQTRTRHMVPGHDLGTRLAAVARPYRHGGKQMDDIDLAGQEGRSEEHTSELQSLMRISYAVFCLKKKNNKS